MTSLRHYQIWHRSFAGLDHGLAVLAMEGLGKRRHIRERPIHPEARHGVRVGIGHEAGELGPQDLAAVYSIH